jgi:hypothetical protein
VVAGTTSAGGIAGAFRAQAMSRQGLPSQLCGRSLGVQRAGRRPLRAQRPLLVGVGIPQPQLHGRRPRCAGPSRSAQLAPARVRASREDTDEVGALPGAHAHDPQQGLRPFVQPVTDMSLHEPQPPRQRRRVVGVRRMPPLSDGRLGHRDDDAYDLSTLRLARMRAGHPPRVALCLHHWMSTQSSHRVDARRSTPANRWLPAGPEPRRPTGTPHPARPSRPGDDHRATGPHGLVQRAADAVATSWPNSFGSWAIASVNSLCPTVSCSAESTAATPRSAVGRSTPAYSATRRMNSS